MKFELAVTAAIALPLLTACAGTTIGLNNTNAPLARGGAPAPGSFYNAASIHAELRPNSYFGLFFLGYLAAGAEDEYLHRRKSHGAVPQMDSGREIAERDCSQPMERPSANLRCR